MSQIKKGALLDNFSFPDLVSDPLSGLQRMYQSFFADDQFNGETDFRAVVISNPKSITVSEYKALRGSDPEGSQSQSFKKFKVRITHKTTNPHAMLQDPCDLSLAKDQCEQNALIAAHTTIVTNKIDAVNIGSYVMIRLKKDSYGTYNLQTGELLEVIHQNQTGATTLSAKACDTIKTYFKYGEAYVPPPPIQMPSELRALAELYDSTDIPGKNTAIVAGADFKPHKTYVEGGRAPAFKKPFNLWVKALIYLAYEQGMSVQITSAFRTQAQQEKLHQEYIDRGRTGLPAACGTCSRHISGFAVDLNFIDSIGAFINSSFDKSDWLATGFPQLAMGEPLFLTWGGNFTKYDPVHFELNPKNWGDNADQFFDQLTNESLNIDTESTGGLTESEQAAMDAEVGINEDDFPPALKDAMNEYDEYNEDEELESEGEGATDLYF